MQLFVKHNDVVVLYDGYIFHIDYIVNYEEKKNLTPNYIYIPNTLLLYF